MARINTARKGTSKTVNQEGAPAYQLSLKEGFASRLMTSLYKEQDFYGDQTSFIVTDAEALLKKDPEFVVRAAAYARNVMHLRTTPTVLCCLIAKHAPEWLRGAMRHVIKRPDQLLEMRAYFVQQGGSKSIRQFKLGVEDALHRFDEYQLAKWRQPKAKFNLAELIRHAHPKPKTEEYAKLFKAIREDTITAPYTWERELSEHGNTAQVWDNLIRSGKVGYMALLRNLRNIIESGAIEFEPVAATISDKNRVMASKQLPFRFYSAWRQLRDLNINTPAKTAIMEAVNMALQHSAKFNIPVMNGVTFMSADNSGSMSFNKISDKSTIQLSDIANLFQGMMAEAYQTSGKWSNDCRPILSVFGEKFREVPYDFTLSIQANAERFKNTAVGHATNAHLAVDHLLHRHEFVDRMIFFTDEEIWDHAWRRQASLCERIAEYRKQINPNVWVHIVCLKSYGTTPVIGDRVNRVFGWSERILDFIRAREEGEGTMIKAINAHDIG